MDELSALLAAGGVVGIIVTLIVAVVVLAMPFLVWGMHSEVKEIRSVLANLESELADMNSALQDMRFILDDVYVDKLSPEALETLAEISRLRVEILKKRVGDLDS